MCTLIQFLPVMGTEICLNPYLLLSWLFEHGCLDTCCFGESYNYAVCVFFLCLFVVVIVVVLYLHLFSAIEHVPHGKVL